MYNLYQKIALWLFILALIVLGAAGYLYGKKINSPAYRQISELADTINFWNGSTDQEIIPTEPATPSTITAERLITFVWKYQGQEYSLKLDLNQELYKQYQNSPKNYSYTGALQSNWLEQYYAMFFTLKPGDQSIKLLAEKLTALAQERALSNDQLVELTIAFIQSIPYDQTRADKITEREVGDFTNYPYETLYTKTGICFDKTFLAILILRELGYGAAVLDYPDANHSAIGIACPKEYSIYNSGYCYAESTNFFPIGVVPEKTAERVVFNQELSAFAGQFDHLFDPDNLGQPDILQQTTGKVYTGIIQTYEKVERIKLLETAIAQGRTEIAQQEATAATNRTALDSLRAQLDGYEQSGDIDRYNALLPDYNRRVKMYNDNLELIELKVKLLNEKIDEYNLLINEFVLVEG